MVAFSAGISPKLSGGDFGWSTSMKITDLSKLAVPAGVDAIGIGESRAPAAVCSTAAVTLFFG